MIKNGNMSRFKTPISLLVLAIFQTLPIDSSPNIVLLSHSPLVEDSETTTLTCADLSTTLPTSLSIRRQFRWGRSLTTESTHTKPALNESGVTDEWVGADTAKAIGVFGCGRGEDAVSAVKMHANGNLVPQDFSQIASVGSKVVIKMNLAEGRSEKLRRVTWYKDGHILDTRGTRRIWEAEGGRALVLSKLSLSDAGVYMARHADEDKLFVAGTILVVRRCPMNKWSTSCRKSCPNCVNGGICSEKTGVCLCPPGFEGTRCEKSCQPSRFGVNCEFSCASLRSEGSTCEGIQQCSVSGCSCVSGWTGLDCKTACHTGYYGANCKLRCDCQNGGRCDQFQGCVCTSAWTGTTCEEPLSSSAEKTPPSDTKSQDGERVPEQPKERKPNITIVEANPSFKVNEGQKVEIQCSATGIPLPQHGEIILKRKDRTEIAPTQTKMSKHVTTSFFSLMMGSYPGPFWCVATTSAGITEKEFNFTIPVLPTPIHPPELVGKGPKYLKLKLNSRPFHGDGPIEKASLLLKQSGQSSFLTYDKNIVNDTVTITDLVPFTNYAFRVLLFREGGYSGRGHPGPTAVIQTDCDFPSRGPTIKNIHAKNDTILYMSWRLPPPSDIKGEVLGYRIYYRVLGEASSWTKVVLEYSSTTSATLKNMKPLAVYSVRIRFYNCAGDSPDSKEVRVTMGRLKKPAGPEVSLVNHTSRYLGFSWFPPTNAKPYTISGYEVLLEELENISPDGLRILQNVSGLEFNHSSLVPYTKYRFTVRAYNHEGPGNFSKELNVTTKEEAPSMPTSFRVSSKTPSEIQLTWKNPQHPNGIIRNYIVNVSKPGEEWIQEKLMGNKKQIRIKNLKEFTGYKFRVQAVTIQPGEWSDEIEERTMSLSPLEAPQSIDVNSPSPQSVSLSWEPPPLSEYVHEVKQYKIVFTDDMRQKVEHWKEKFVPGKERFVEVGGLRSDTVYLFAMAAVTQKPGPYSERKTIRTLRLTRPPPPKNVYVTNITSHSATLRWQIADGYSITNVRARVKSVGTLKWEDRLFLAETGEASLNLLQPGTKYDIELTAGNHIGESSSNPSVNFQTSIESTQRVGGGFSLLYILVPALSAVVLVLGIIIYCKCRHRSDSDSISTAPLEMDSISNHIRASTIGSSFQGAINSRSGTIISSHSIHSGISRAPSTHSGQLLLPDNLILSWESIFFEDITLGEGNFGQVVKAVVQVNEKCIQAAVKLLKDGCSADDRKDFLAELDMMVRIGGHQNIVSLIGACEHNGCLYLCTEFAPNGNLLQFLRKSRRTGIDGTYTTLTQEQLLQFALDVCQGMAYLSEKELIHRDLAARNVLLSGNLTCKVADFGLSRGEGVYVKKTVARLPIRWMAIESLNYNVYTTKSDVWSFGVLLWEIVSLGGTPYYGMSCAELYEKLPRGYRMDQPLNCDGEIYKLMCQCWKDRPYDRPSFSQLCVALKRMIDARSTNYVNTAIFENFKFSKIDANEEEEG